MVGPGCARTARARARRTHAAAARLADAPNDGLCPVPRRPALDVRSSQTLAKGAKLTVHTDDAWKEKCDAENLYMDYKNLPKVMKVGGVIFVDDGLISLKVDAIDVAAGTLSCTVRSVTVFSTCSAQRAHAAVRRAGRRRGKGVHCASTG